jgi:Right handed beta helix region/Immunoglobulin I-set domain
LLESVKTTSLSLILVVVLAHTAHAATYYVSKSGSDSNTGTSTNLSFLTIQKAASLMNASDTCYILSGIYRETVTPAHSGASGSPITFAAYPGATPIVSGADVLSLSCSVYSNSIYQAGTAKSFRQLFVDGVMMNEARWPNATVDNLLYAPRSIPSSCTLTNLVDASLPNVNLLGATLHIFPNEYANQGYAANTRQITGWDSSTKTISWGGNIFDSGAVGTLYYVYGALSLLDIPTEWYLQSGTLYLWTPDGASPATHVIEIKARTSAFTLNNRSYVAVSGIYVFGAGISMANTTSCVVDNCNLRYVQHNTTADWTVDVPIANQVSGSGSIWKNSTIKFSSQDGIRCTGQNEVASNCVIQQVDYYPGTYYAGVTAFSGGSGTKIVNNTLTYSGRYCVGACAPSVEIAYNDLGWGDLLTSDGGAEYVYVGAGDGGGTTIHHNWAHNSWAGIYIDGLQNNYVVYRNVCWSNYVGLMFNQFTNNLIYNNTSVSNSAHDIEFNGSSDVNVQLINNIWHTSRNYYSGTTTVADNGWYPPLDTNHVPQAGSGAIDAGTLLPPYTDGYVGAAPDIGAYEVGGAYWTPGANFTPQPFPNPYAAPSIVTQPTNSTNYAGQTVTFTVVAAGAPPLYYQWRGGVHGSGVYNNLIGGGQFSGVTNATMTISNLVSGNAADYVVVITNANGSVTSAVAVLTVPVSDVAITAQPASQTNIIGQTAAFIVTATGAPPLYYQWRAAAIGSGIYTNLIAGSQFSAVTNAALYITNLVSGNAADYVVVVTNSFSSITSAVARLTVLTNSSYQSTILADHPVSYWPLQETNGPTIHEIVGTNNGTMMVGDHSPYAGQYDTWIVNDGSAFGMGGPGVLFGETNDTAIYFTNANHGSIFVPYAAGLDGANFTAEAWLNFAVYPITPPAPTVDMAPLDFSSNGGSQYGWLFSMYDGQSGMPSGYMQGSVGKGAGWLTTPTPDSVQFNGQWVYAVLTPL